jgi:hypothetical protein
MKVRLKGTIYRTFPLNRDFLSEPALCLSTIPSEIQRQVSPTSSANASY